MSVRPSAYYGRPSRPPQGRQGRALGVFFEVVCDSECMSAIDGDFEVHVGVDTTGRADDALPAGEVRGSVQTGSLNRSADRRLGELGPRG